MTIDEDVCTCDDRSYDRCGWCRRRPIEVSAGATRCTFVSVAGSACELEVGHAGFHDATTRPRTSAAQAVTDEERARTWTRAIWEDPDDEYAKVKRLISDVRRETIEACAKAIEAEIIREAKTLGAAFEPERRRLANMLRATSTPCAPAANFTNDSEGIER